MVSHSEIQTLLAESAYDPSVCPKLEAYVRAQVSAVASTLVASESPDVQYCFDANRTLIKLYQFFPHLEGELGMTITALAAFLALLRFPETDFMALSCLIPDRVQSSEPCATLVRCAELLESCQFSEFWPEFRKLGIPEYGARDGETVVSEDRKLLSNAVNGPTACSQIRSNMIKMLARTYRSAPLSVVLAALDLKDGASLADFGSKVVCESEAPIVEKVEGDVVTFAASAENSKRVGSAFKEGVSYDQVASMMSKTALRQ
jgi:translation initiation factor 3 subunit K